MRNTKCIFPRNAILVALQWFYIKHYFDYQYKNPAVYLSVAKKLSFLTIQDFGSPTIYVPVFYGDLKNNHWKAYFSIVPCLSPLYRFYRPLGCSVTVHSKNKCNFTSNLVVDTATDFGVTFHLRVPTQFKKKFNDFSMIFHDQQYNFHYLLMHCLPPHL